MKQLQVEDSFCPIRGFSFVTTMMVIMVGSLVISLFAFRNSGYDIDGIQKINDLEKVRYIRQYIYNRYTNLPCPANPRLKKGDADYMKSQGIFPVCNTSNLVVDATSKYFKGDLPVVTLGLNADMAFDSNGNKISYEVAGTADNRISGSKKFFVKILSHDCYNYLTNSNCSDTSKYVSDSNSKAANFALISYGKNSVGAYNRSGKIIKPVTLANGKYFDNLGQAVNHKLYVGSNLNDNRSSRYIYEPLLPAGNPLTSSDSISNIYYDDVVITGRKDVFIPQAPNINATYGLLGCAFPENSILKLSIVLTVQSNCEVGTTTEWKFGGVTSTANPLLIIPILAGGYNVEAVCVNSDGGRSKSSNFNFSASLFGLGGGPLCI